MSLLKYRFSDAFPCVIFPLWHPSVFLQSINQNVTNSESEIYLLLFIVSLLLWRVKLPEGRGLCLLFLDEFLSSRTLFIYRFSMCMCWIYKWMNKSMNDGVGSTELLVEVLWHWDLLWNRFEAILLDIRLIKELVNYNDLYFLYIIRVIRGPNDGRRILHW